MNLINKKKVLTHLKPYGLLLVMFFSTAIITEISASPVTTIYVYPPTKTVSVGQTFVIEIKISDVLDLYGWEFKLSWDPSLLDAIDVTEGEFLKRGGDTFFYPIINNTVGYIFADCTLLGDVLGVSGDGTLASVKFYAEKEGSTSLNLHDTILINSFEQSIPHTVNDGNVTISQPVGGIRIPVNKIVLLAPWIGTGLTVIFILIIIIVFTKYRKRKNKFSVSHINTAKGAL